MNFKIAVIFFFFMQMSMASAMPVTCDESKAQSSFDSSTAAGSSSDYRIYYRAYDKVQVVNFSGEMEPLSSEKDLVELESHLQPNKDILLSIGTSYGGYNKLYTRLINDLRGACPKGSCTIYSYSEAECASACIELYMNGDLRILGPKASFGFHQQYVGLGRMIMIKIQSKQKFANLYVGLGADPEWVQEHLDELTSDEKNATWVNSFDLYQGKFADIIDGNNSTGANWSNVNNEKRCWPALQR